MKLFTKVDLQKQIKYKYISPIFSSVWTHCNGRKLPKQCSRIVISEVQVRVPHV